MIEDRLVSGRVAVGLAAAVVVLLLVAVFPVGPAKAAITLSPSSATVEGGSQSVVSTTATSDVGAISASASSPLTVLTPGNCASPCVINVRVSASAAPGSYGVSVSDAGGTPRTFTVNVTAPATTTTTTAAPTTTTTAPPATTTTRPPTTTTTRPPTTTTTRPATTTTTSTTTTTIPPIITTTVAPATTTTSAPTTTTTSTTTTTVPPTTTTPTLVPAALGSSGGGSDSESLVPWIAGIAVALVAVGGFLAYRSQRRPTYAAASSGAFFGIRRRREERRAARRARSSRSVDIGAWWRTSGPIVSYHEWRATRHATKTVRRQIAERQRLRKDGD